RVRDDLARRRQPPPLPLFPGAKRFSAQESLLFVRILALISLIPPAFSTSASSSSISAASTACVPQGPLDSRTRALSRSEIFTDLIHCVPFVSDLLLRLLAQIRERKCGWITSPPMVCAHGGDSTDAFPNSDGSGRAGRMRGGGCLDVLRLCALRAAQQAGICKNIW
ncbi:unnamed protein product, partial [Urochloa humidicola]